MGMLRRIKSYFSTLFLHLAIVHKVWNTLRLFKSAEVSVDIHQHIEGNGIIKYVKNI